MIIVSTCEHLSGYVVQTRPGSLDSPVVHGCVAHHDLGMLRLGVRGAIGLFCRVTLAYTDSELAVHSETYAPSGSEYPKKGLDFSCPLLRIDGQCLSRRSFVCFFLIQKAGGDART